jgi:hypothetical protein
MRRRKFLQSTTFFILSIAAALFADGASVLAQQSALTTFSQTTAQSQPAASPSVKKTAPTTESVPLPRPRQRAQSVEPKVIEIDQNHLNDELNGATRSVLEGRVQAGLDRLTSLLGQIDPTKDRDAYCRTGATLVEYLTQTENHARASQVLNSIVATKGFETSSVCFQWMQFYIGRTLAYLGKAGEGEKFLHALTGGDARLVYTPAQRAAAVMLSKIELDRGNVSQAAIWMRRAVIATLVVKGATSEEILNVLAEYANYLARTHRLLEANNLFMELGPLYEKWLAHHSPKYMRFLGMHLATLADIGKFASAELVTKSLNDNAAAVDIVAPSVRETIFLQNLYQMARAAHADGQASITERLKQLVSSSPEFLEQPRIRLAFTYFALFAGDGELADQILSSRSTEHLDAQSAIYEVILRSAIAVRRNKFNESISLSRDALDGIRRFYQRFETESSSRMPAITAEERVVLSSIVTITAQHVSTLDEANTLFQLEQFLNREKGKLGLNAKVARQTLKSDLQREDIRTRDRLQNLRDKILNDAIDALLARVPPIRDYAPGQANDVASLLRLEEVEDKIASANEQLRRSATDFSKFSADGQIDISAVQRILRANEALVLHIVAGGPVTTCISRDNWSLYVNGLDKAQPQQFFIDVKLLSAAVHGTHEPSAELDSSFPSENSYRLYQALFGGIEPCLRNKTHILLATDPDLFSLPWNALLTAPPPADYEFHHREAAWLPKSYSLSLLPSVQALYQLRDALPPSRARERFLGIGHPISEVHPNIPLRSRLGLCSLHGEWPIGQRLLAFRRFQIRLMNCVVSLRFCTHQVLTSFWVQRRQSANSASVL